MTTNLTLSLTQWFLKRWLDVFGRPIWFFVSFLLLSSPLSIADAPEGRYLVYSDTVVDQVTQLIWQRHPSDAKLTRQEGLGYCAGQTIEGATWRLPTISELESIIDRSQHNWALDPNAFPKPTDPMEDRFWSSTPAARNPLHGWYVDFYHGNSNTWSESNGGYVRCVR